MRFFALVVILALGSVGFLNQLTSAERPNLIYIMVDDLGYGDLGCYGQERIKTPRIDQLAEEGLRFTDHYAGQTVCRPSRLVHSIGKHTGHTPIVGNEPYVLPEDETTVSSLLQANGYRTGCVGKWALGDVGTSGHPNRQGFDFFYGYLDQSRAHNYYPEFLFRNEQKERLPGNVESDQRMVAKTKVTYSHTRMTDEALDFIRETVDETFYLNLTWTIPHTNNQAGRANGDGQEVPDYGIYSDKDWPNPEKGYAAMVTLMDRDVGRIVDLLKELEIDDNTLLVFTSDNGPHQEGGHRVEFFDSNGKLRGFKRSLYDGGIRVPMIAWWPGTVRPGVSDHVCSFWDWLPTACELAGIETSTETDGISFAPLLLGNNFEQAEHEALFWKWGKFRAVRMGDWKGVEVDGDVELYNVSQDPSEAIDVTAQHADVVEKVKRKLNEMDGNK